MEILDKEAPQVIQDLIDKDALSVLDIWKYVWDVMANVDVELEALRKIREEMIEADDFFDNVEVVKVSQEVSRRLLDTSDGLHSVSKGLFELMINPKSPYSP